MEDMYSQIKTHFDVDNSVKELIKLRGYVEGSEQHKLLKDLQICSCAIYDIDELGTKAKNLGAITNIGRFLLDDRFIIPVRDIEGNLVTLIGYYPDYKKYITMPAPFFSKEAMFFNIDQAFDLSYDDFGGAVFLVEGIFDCLSLRAIGLPAIATMGSDVTSVKRETLKLFSKVVYIPDNDKVGHRALNRYDTRYGWKVPKTATGIRLKGSVDFGSQVLKVKDIDNLITWCEADDVRELLLAALDSKSDIETLQV